MIEIGERLRLLKELKREISSCESEICEALRADFNKPKFDCYATEIGLTLEEIGYMIRRVKKFSRPKSARVSLKNFPSRARIIPEPFGKVLIISPWNYPFQLSFMPLIGAISAGNTVTLKPSSKTPHTYKIIEKIITHVFDKEIVSVTSSRDVLDSKFDFIFFTGGKDTARKVMTSAAKNLTPVVLECGGKSPAIVDEDACIATAARRLAWGKFLNGGQTCVAPDYILAHKSVVKQFTASFIAEIKRQFYTSSGELSLDFPQVIDEAKAAEVARLIDGEKVIFGGKHSGRTFEPTVLESFWTSKIMENEIFAPVAPIIEFDDLGELKRKLASLDKPLAMYYFGKNREIMRELSFGGGCVNDAVMHVSETNLPFGGVGASGMGRYHGRQSYETFSHYKSVLYKGGFDFPARFSPHSDGDLSLIKKIIK